MVIGRTINSRYLPILILLSSARGDSCIAEPREISDLVQNTDLGHIIPPRADNEFIIETGAEIIF